MSSGRDGVSGEWKIDSAGNEWFSSLPCLTESGENNNNTTTVSFWGGAKKVKQVRAGLQVLRVNLWRCKHSGILAVRVWK
jgi:hypothetical protein